MKRMALAATALFALAVTAGTAQADHRTSAAGARVRKPPTAVHVDRSRGRHTDPRFVGIPGYSRGGGVVQVGKPGAAFAGHRHHANRGSYSYGRPYSYGRGYGYGQGYGRRYGHGYGYGRGHSYGHRYGHSYGHRYAHPHHSGFGLHLPGFSLHLGR